MYKHQSKGWIGIIGTNQQEYINRSLAGLSHLGSAEAEGTEKQIS
jgi:hypothetical protein